MLSITLQETRVYQDVKAEGLIQGLECGLVQGRGEKAVNLVVRLLTKRFGEAEAEMRSVISGLPLVVVEDLSVALLDFKSLADLETWLLQQ